MSFLSAVIFEEMESHKTISFILMEGASPLLMKLSHVLPNSCMYKALEILENVDSGKRLQIKIIDFNCTYNILECEQLLLKS